MKAATPSFVSSRTHSLRPSATMPLSESGAVSYGANTKKRPAAVRYYARGCTIFCRTVPPHHRSLCHAPSLPFSLFFLYPSGLYKFFDLALLLFVYCSLTSRLSLFSPFLYWVSFARHHQERSFSVYVCHFRCIIFFFHQRSFFFSSPTVPYG